MRRKELCPLYFIVLLSPLLVDSRPQNDDPTRIVLPDEETIPRQAQRGQQPRPQRLKRFCDPSCNRIVLPVCGTDGRTYNNRCILNYFSCLAVNNNRREIRVKRQGKCNQNRRRTKRKVRLNCSHFKCPDDFLPVCGSDRKTHRNRCHLRAEACNRGEDIFVTSEGECVEQEESGQARKCPAFCFAILRPVCGTNGVTYGNECSLKAESCRDESLDIHHFGACKKGIFGQQQIEEEEEESGEFEPVIEALEVGGGDHDEEDQSCALQLSPVCGSDGTTYVNECQLRKWAEENSVSVFVLHEGTCEDTRDERQTATESNCTQECPTNVDLICGTDGRQYANECILKALACMNDNDDLGVDKAGRCRNCDIRYECSLNFDPICGSDNRTYDNNCVFHGIACEQDLFIQYEGECREVELRAGCNKCTHQYIPVCGTDGNTYSNICNLNEAKRCRGIDVKFDYDGECEDKKQSSPLIEALTAEECKNECEKLYIPVCGTDGKTYGNNCEFEKARDCRFEDVEIAYEGECKIVSPAIEALTAEECKNECEKLYVPVCGTDGKTYGNNCEFEKARDCRFEDVEISHEGPCDDQIIIRGKETADKECGKCNKILSPVCGSDGQTYLNECTLKREACLSGMEGLVHMSYHAPCRKKDKLLIEKCKICTKELSPVCGNDGKTYLNSCSLKSTACMMESQLQEAYEGPCRKN